MENTNSKQIDFSIWNLKLNNLQIQRYITSIKGEIAMVQILAGEKGVDDDNSRMYDLHYSVRFVDTPKFIMENTQVFRGFVYGILSQNSDIEKIYIDGLNHIMEKVDDKDFITFINHLESISKESETDFTMIISRKEEELPKEVQPYLVK